MHVDKLVFILMLLLALYIVVCRNYKRIIVALGAFSLLASFCYLLYHAPDVAIAEAVIGSALSTILFIVALKKHRTFYIFFTSGENETIGDQKLRIEMNDVVSKITTYLVDHDLEAQAVYSHEDPKTIANEHLYDLILHKENNTVTMYGSDDELHVLAIRELLKDSLREDRMVFVNTGTNSQEEDSP